MTLTAYGTERAIPYTILRPGVVFGPGRTGSILGRCGVDTFGFFMHVTGRYPVPLTYVDNCAEAIVMTGLADGVNAEVFNVVDDSLPSSAALVRIVKQQLGRFFSVRVPYRLFFLFCRAWEGYAAWSQNQLPPVFNRKMCAAYHKGNRYSNDKLKQMVGWAPAVPMEEALARYFQYMKSAAQSRSGAFMLRIGIVGCGKIADAHAAQIQRIRDCRMVGVCDPEPIMAEQLAERYGIDARYTELHAFLDAARPEVVHITTPPQSHLSIGLKCLEYGANILVEKPFTIDTKDARTLLAAADRAGRKVTVGHDAQFSPVARDMRHLVEEGYLGGPPVHMESHWCYDLTDPTYARALLADTHHWARQLPGGLPHNIINHGISKVAEFIESDTPRVLALGFVSPFLRSLGNTELVDELRVIVHEERGTTAYFTFSTQMRPSLHQFSIYGHRNGITIDEDKRTLIKLRGTSYKSYAEHFLQPMPMRSIRRKLYPQCQTFPEERGAHGRREILSVQTFYDSILNGTQVPIPYREIILTSYIMDEIFAQVSPLNRREEAQSPDQSRGDLDEGRLVRRARRKSGAPAVGICSFIPEDARVGGRRSKGRLLHLSGAQRHRALLPAGWLGPGDEVLAPAYNCGAEIDPFIKAGAKVVLYDVNRRLGIDPDGIARSITPATRVVYVTHFFGFSQCIDSLAAVCKRKACCWWRIARRRYSVAGQ